MQNTTLTPEQLSINLDQQSTLARLLAQENIKVIHGAYKTAWFNPSSRTLALPIWKNRGKAVYDLLTGHEVGHALFTPAQGWHDALFDNRGAPKAYLNVLEDVRIERKVQAKYPGLSSQFRKAYKQLNDEDFFGLANVDDVNELLLIDRINLKSKLGPNIEVKFNAVEQSFYDRSFTTESFQQVVALAIEIYQYQKAQKKNNQQPKFQPSVAPNGDAMFGEEDNSNDYEKPDEYTQNQQGGQSSEGGSEDEEIDSNAPTSSINDSTKGDKKEIASKEAKGKNSINDTSKEEDLESITDNAFRENEKNLTFNEQELNSSIICSIDKMQQDDVIVDYKTYYALWKKQLEALSDYRKIELNSSLTKLAEGEYSFKKFKLSTETNAAHMAKEFEMRKAAFQNSRSTVSKTGMIDTNKLHTYKYSEDIFLKSTRLANYKNHGMMLFLDFSGSMQNNIGATIRQMINLTTFCRMIQIPFEVYAFTNETLNDTSHRFSYSDGEVMINGFHWLNMLSSTMSRKTYNESIEMLYYMSQAYDHKLDNRYITYVNKLSSTPLNKTIIYAAEIVKKFKAKHKVEKMTTMFLTDGESDGLDINTDYYISEENRLNKESSFYTYRRTPTYIRFLGKTVYSKSGLHSPKVTSELLKVFGEYTNSKVLGFFITSSRNESIRKILDELDIKSYNTKAQMTSEYNEQFKRNKCLITDGVYGYDRYFTLYDKSLDIDDLDLDEVVVDGSDARKIQGAFTKVSKQKRVNRVLLNSFVDAMA